MNILVTGGAGYIGSHAVRELIDSGHHVTVLDNLSHGFREAVHHEARFVLGDVSDVELLGLIFKGYSIEAVMHFAAFIEVGESVADPGKYYTNNFSNALAMLKTMAAYGVRKLVFSSTAAVYGNPLQVPISEEHPLQPMSPYGRSKMMVELALQDFAEAHGIGYAILRYFNVAGATPDGSIGEAHEPESHLIPRVLAACLAVNPTPVQIFGTDYPTHDGTCIRDYVHVEDLARAHILALQNLRWGCGSVFNLGSETGFSVREVIAACEEVAGVRLHVEEQARRPGDPAALVASSRKIKSLLGWQPHFADLKTIIAHAWNWHVNHPTGYLESELSPVFFKASPNLQWIR